MRNRRLLVLLLGLVLCASLAGASPTSETTSEAAATGDVEVTAGGYTWPSAWLAPQTASQAGIKKFNEAPEFEAAVKAGTLPPVEQRLPDDPAVIAPYRSVGKYGGTIRVARINIANGDDVTKDAVAACIA